MSVVLSESALSVDEGDSTGSDYTVRLSHRPSEQVTVTVSGQAGTDVSVDKDTLTFTMGNWNTPQTVTVTAADDHDTSDDAVTLAHTASGGEYAGVSAALAVTVIDDDTPDLVLSTTTLEVMEGDAGGATYTVKLATEPSAEVTVTVSGQIGTDVSVDKDTLTFTMGNWNTPQTVTVTAGPDHDADDEVVTLAHSASGAEYAGVSAALAVTVVDDDTPELVLSTTTIEVMEGAASGATYTVRLATEPSAEVTVAVTGHSGTDLTLTGLSGTSAVTFTTDNWDTVQTVKVTADHDLDGGTIR